MEAKILILKAIAVIVLGILMMWCIKKLVESVINFITVIKASKDINHEANAESAGVVLNKKTKKLEGCGRVIKLPF